MALASLAIDDDVGHLTLDRASKRNALSQDLIETLLAKLDEAEDANPRALLIQGEGPVFCAGGDIGWMEERLGDPAATQRALEEHVGPLIERVATFPAPTLAAVQGAALGAGLGLALACDLTFVAKDATLGATQASLGLAPDGGTSWLLTHAIGPSKALALILRAETMTGKNAAKLGLATDAYAEPHLLEHAKAHAAALAQGPTQALLEARNLIQQASQSTLKEALAHEAQAQARIYKTEDPREGVEAFFEGREPQFEGR